ncbi:MAG: SDR family oxidoreductase [Rhodospirillaceae bacterium]|jgi:NAD(P)-dependent dehydrogenase (short-subunit alcohol dehydrogenase family)|nr:SDR family oxidoreductase [Rhodospirillaceae bacterium]
MPTVLITGSNRGLGLEFARQYAAAGWKVLATCREPQNATELNTVEGDIQVLPLDVSDFLAIDTVSRILSAEKIDLLLNNAGLNGSPAIAFGETDYEDWSEVFRVNTQAPLKMAECFVEQVANSDKKLIVSLSSRLGSISENDEGEQYSYRSSKAALNAVNKSMSVDLAGRGITTAVLHPGWARTDMGGPNAAVDPVDSVSGMRAVIDNLTSADSGRNFSYDGSSIDW